LINPQRIRNQENAAGKEGPVLYWMHREFRAESNWALIYAREQALQRKVPVAVVFCLSPSFIGATLRQYDFLLRGLEQSARTLRAAGVPLILRCGSPPDEMLRLCAETRPALVVTDFDPLRIKRQWVQRLAQQVRRPVHEVDSRNIVPAWIASDRREFMARTFRVRIRRQLSTFLDPFPELDPHPFAWEAPVPSLDFSQLRASLKVDARVPPVSGQVSGELAGREALSRFIEQRLANYHRRNDPNADVCSGLSPYLHFGMISSQSIMLEIRRRGLGGDNVDSFLDELIVRRELSDNFCFHTPGYDQIAGFPQWAQHTLEKHRRDKRAYLYTEEQFEGAQTHDPLWNGAQQQLIVTGTMHGYMRMYWAKKILEWTEDPAEALRIAIWLNDRYALDGRDSNGYTGIAWSIGGVHDRGWAERPIFGTVRFMNEAGARRKFDVNRFIRTWSSAQLPIFPVQSSL